MKTSQKGIDLIKKFEGCSLTAYKCPAGVLTIGFGHVGNIRAGSKITMEQAENLLREDLPRYEAQVDKYDYIYHWTQNEYDALVSFAYNIGSINQLTQNGLRTKSEIANKMLLYINTYKGTPLEGLKRRREAERALYLAQDSNTNANEYKTVEDVCRGIWAGDFGTPWSKSDALYKYFQKLINEGVGK